MNISIVGTGYVGLPTGIGLASLGHSVTCIDIDDNKIKKLNAGELTLYEKGLNELFKQTLNKSLFFSTDFNSVKNADVVLIAVGTPMNKETKAADLKYIWSATQSIAKNIRKYTVVCDKSTVPVGTGDKVESIIKQINPNADFDVVSLPEFLREGFAVEDFYHPDRIIIGTEAKRAYETIVRMYSPLLVRQTGDNKTTVLKVSRKSAEAIKYASNSFLAVKIHFINEMSDFCEKSGANIRDVAKGIGLDTRIGPKFLEPGPGYGGSCFPKDTNAMVKMGKEYGVTLSLIETAIKNNENRKVNMAHRIINAVGKNNDKLKVGVLGLAFKAGTDDCRDSPAMEIALHLITLGAEVHAYDPKAMEIARSISTDIIYFDTAEQACEGVDVVAILTEWEEFKNINLHRLKCAMRGNVVVDLRKVFTKETVEKVGLSFITIG